MRKRGGDFSKPYNRAANNARMDVRRESYTNARMRSHTRRLLPICAHTARHKAQQRCCVWSTTNASSINRANPTARCGGPCP
jgi:hypothetical protein